MTQLIQVCSLSWLAGIAAAFGGVIAKRFGSADTTDKRELAHGMVAFGGGILIAAVAFALVPEGIQFLPTATLAATFCAGGIVFCGFDVVMARQGGSKAQFVAMLTDFLPEALAMGAVFAHDHHLGLLLALFIGVQNIPEGFNAYREVLASGMTSRRALSALSAISLLGPVAAGIGYFFLQNQPPLTAAIMCFAGGGILYLTFQDIAPKSTMRRHWTPPLGAVLGFTIGMIGRQLLG